MSKRTSVVVGLVGLAALTTSGLLLTGIVGSASAASPTTANQSASQGSATTAAADPTTSCNGVLNGAGAGRLDKRLVSVVETSSGTYDFTFQVTSGRDPGSYRLRDCVYIDEGAPGYQDEPVIAGTDDKGVVFTAGPDGSVAVFTVTVTGIGPNKLVCDRAAVSGEAAGGGFTDKSNEVCVDPNNPPVVPEAPMALVLPLAVLGTAAVTTAVLRRRGAATTVAATA